MRHFAYERGGAGVGEIEGHALNGVGEAEQQCAAHVEPELIFGVADPRRPRGL